MATQQPSFFTTVQLFAKPFVKADAAKQDPITVARTRFAAAADEAIKDITADKDKGFWFKKMDSGYTVQLKKRRKGAGKLLICSWQ